MPFYEYTCTDCGHEVEVLQKMSDLPLDQCPACGQDTLKKLVSASAFHLKGTGWYKTDFSGKKTKPEKKPEEKPEEKSSPPPASSNTTSPTVK